MRTLTLFAGIGCGMLAGLLVGHVHVAAVEWIPYRAAVLRERAADEWFPGLVVHECDIRTFDPRPYAGRVDCICAGFPCQDISRLGTGAGLDGERSGLWSEVRRCVDVLRPEYVFLENGPDLLSLGADRVLADLAALGYDAQWGIVAGENAGADHGRPRFWLLAHRVRDGLEGKLRGGQRHGQLAEAVYEFMAHADEAGWQRQPQAGLRDGGDPWWRNPDGCLSFIPGRADRAGWEAAWRDGAPEPGVRRMADAAAWRMVKAQVAAIGDGQDVLCAAFAWKLLGGPMPSLPVQHDGGRDGAAVEGGSLT